MKERRTTQQQERGKSDAGIQTLEGLWDEQEFTAVLKKIRRGGSIQIKSMSIIYVSDNGAHGLRVTIRVVNVISDWQGTLAPAFVVGCP